MLGIVGKKLGMTRLYDAVGEVIPVTVIEVVPAVVVQKKTEEIDGYSALQLGYHEVKKNKVNKSSKGHFAKHSLQPKRDLLEFTVPADSSYEVGQEIVWTDVFEGVEFVDVAGRTKGKGFAGVIKRHNFSRGPETHGSRHHREPGSVGATGPARVMKGQKMPGRMGNKNMTVQSLKVVRIDADQNLIFVKGAVPGNRMSEIIVKPAVKK